MPSASEVVVYTALDSEFSRPIFDDYQRTTGATVAPKFDTESTKTVGLTNALLAESARPRADVFWNNEILNTLRLEKAGLLDAYFSPQSEYYPQAFRASNGTWHGFAARARVLIVNTERVPEAERPRSILDLTKPAWKGRAAIAKPLFGTTATHAACLFAAWGPERAQRFYRDLRANEIQVLSGNKQVAQAVGTGSSGVVVGFTDTDDALAELAAGRPVAILYPDREQDELGTLFIPNTLSILKGGPNPRAAKQLVDYLLSREVELKLAQGPSGQIPLRTDIEVSLRVESPRTVKAMIVDFTAAADLWDQTAEFLQREFARD